MVRRGLRLAGIHAQYVCQQPERLCAKGSSREDSTAVRRCTPAALPQPCVCTIVITGTGETRVGVPKRHFHELIRD